MSDIRRQLAAVPPGDLEGLWSVGLAASTRKDCWVYGRYWNIGKPKICLYSYPSNLEHRLAARTKRSEIERWLGVELQHGMTVRQEGGRFVCQWPPDDLRRFMLEHVLMHEIGHHVFYRQRAKQGIVGRPSKQVREQFAEDYALRSARDRNVCILPSPDLLC